MALLSIVLVVDLFNPFALVATVVVVIDVVIVDGDRLWLLRWRS